MKRKININRPQISSEEIAKRKNFDSVLKKSASIGAKPLLKKPWFLSSVVAVTIAIVATVVLLNQDKKNDADQVVAENNTEVSPSDSLALEAFYKEQEAKPCISPPIKGLNIPYASYKVIAEKGAALDFKTGSKIIVPKSAFVDEKGNVIKGEVELRYREFHDAADFFVSGIPMTYDSAGVKYQFESAGMVEVLAYQNGKQVNMAPQKEIKIELASNYKGTEYNLYKLDTVANNWSCLGKDKVVTTKKVPEDVNAPIVADPEDIAKQTPEYKTLEVKKVELKKVKETELAILPKPLPEPDKPQQVKKGKFTFNLDVDPKEFPELSVYKGVLFEVGDENTNFNASMYDITWDEATVKEGSKSGENYKLTLKKATKKYDLVVYPVFEGKDYEVAMKDFQEKFNKYKVTLDKRIASEKKIEEDYQARVAEYQRQQEAMIAKIKKDQEDRFKQADTEEKVRRMFVVNSFGIYNCDNPSVYPKGVLCKANVKSDLDKNLKCYQVYLVDKQKNGLFTYFRNPIMTFSFNPKSTNMLWTVEDGVIYWLKPEQFAAINDGGFSDLKMNRVEQKFANVDELKAYFNF